MTNRLTFLLLCGLAPLTSFAQEEFKSYTQKISGSKQDYEMVAIPGGEFMMGSPASEKGRNH
jgi:formylglycine-generating enzyme required for sulfatase activity